MRSLALFSASMGCQFGGTETYVQTIAQQLRGEISDLRLITGGSASNFTADYCDLLQSGTFADCHYPILDRYSLPGRLLQRSRLGSKICPADLESISALASWHKIRSFVKGAQLLEVQYPLDGLLFPILPREIAKILHFHGAWPSPLFKKMAKLILHHTDCCIACSRYARDELEKIIPSPAIEVVYNGVDIDVFSPGCSHYTPPCSYDPGCLKVGTVARLSHDKGSDLLCRVAAELTGEVELFLAGPVDSTFSDEFEKLSDAPNIHYLGPVDHGQIADFYRFLDCFVLPSRFEAFPLTILEAMACGCAIIATRVGGIPEMIGPKEEAGSLVSLDDSITLKTQLHRLSQDRNISHYMCSQARDRVVEHFSLQRTVVNVLGIYKRVLENKEINKAIEG